MATLQRISWAEWRPLGDITDEPPITPSVLIYHTLVGSLYGADRFFRVGNGVGFNGTESTFGVGGKWGADADHSLDGDVWQWQACGRQADAQFAGNAYANSVETADGGNPNNPWTSAQLASLVRLTVDWCRGTGNPCELVKAPTGKGLGYHRLFGSWNLNKHSCPGLVREGQLRTIVIPKARATLTGRPVPHVEVKTGPLAVDGIFGHDTIAMLQIACGAHSDGIFGPTSRRRLQRHLGVVQDGDIGPITTKALQAYLVHRGFATRITGTWSTSTTKALQRALNAGKF